MRCSKERRFNHFLGAAEQREWESDARAIAFAMPLLQKADRVTVLTVIGGTEVSGPSAEELVRKPAAQLDWCRAEEGWPRWQKHR
jgi:hypothetical protein